MTAILKFILILSVLYLQTEDIQARPCFGSLFDMLTMYDDDDDDDDDEPVSSKQSLIGVPNRVVPGAQPPAPVPAAAPASAPAPAPAPASTPEITTGVTSTIQQ